VTDPRYLVVVADDTPAETIAEVQAIADAHFAEFGAAAVKVVTESGRAEAEAKRAALDAELARFDARALANIKVLMADAAKLAEQGPRPAPHIVFPERRG
jgi:hypothetical protein